MEGTDVARWLNDRGVAAFVLKYRLIRTGDDLAAQVRENLSDRNKMQSLMQPLRPLVLADGQQAVRVVRGGAAGWGLAPDRIGMLGFSAGAMVTTSVALEHDAGSRPDFAAAIYSAGRDEISVPADAPPLFVLCAADDEMASVRSLQLYAAWRERGHPVELHIYATGGHGFGMRTQGLPADSWIERFGDWLQAQGMLRPDANL
jgi:acetyl esterase/lipase